MTEEEFLSFMKPYAIEGWQTHQVLPSIMGAQAANESEYGTSTLATESNNLFGIKGTPNAADSKNYPTKEEIDGVLVEQDAWFRVYDSKEDSIANYLEFLNGERYESVVGETDYHEAAYALVEAGYATDSSYAEKLITIIERYQLYKWDEEALGSETPGTTGTFLIALGHGRNSIDGEYDRGASGNGETEAGWLRGDFLTSMKNYAANASATIEFYEEDLYANREAATIEGYDAIVELHMDAADSSSAKGGHLIVYEEDTPDDLDQRLKDVVKKHFGISAAYQETDGFSYRGEGNNNNLYNVTTLFSRGIMNSFVELCFITNQENMDYFKTNYDEVASDIIEVISGSEVSTPPIDPEPEPEPDPDPVTTSIRDIQSWLNNTYAAGLDVDNGYGPLTVSAVIRGIQTELNAQLGANITVDGVFGPASQAAWVTVRFGSQGNFTRLIQAQLIGLGYNVNGFDGEFGQGLYTAIQAFQSDYGLEVDGRVGPATAYALFTALEGEDEGTHTPTLIHEVQQWLNQTYATGLAVDGLAGPATLEAVVIGIQTELNLQFGANITVDGMFGPASQAAWDTVRFGSQGNFTRLIQAQLIVLGYDTNGFDGEFGQGLYTAVQDFQSNNGLEVDGRVGPATAYTLFNQ